VNALALAIALAAGVLMGWLLTVFPRVFATATFVCFSYVAWQCAAESLFVTAALLAVEGGVITWIVFDIARIERATRGLEASRDGKAPEVAP
jgi:hypothetical protein